QVLAGFSLNGILPHKLAACGESAEKLVVQVIAIRQDDQGGVGHPRMLDDFPGIENHGQAFPASLGVPDHAHAPISPWPRRFQRAAYRFVDGMELVIAGNLLFEQTFCVLEDNEVADQIEKAPLLEDTPYQDFEFK